MFTGIIETMGIVKDISIENTNSRLEIQSSLSSELTIDQSISHNGVCLTIVDVGPNWHAVVAVLETLERSNLGKLQIGHSINLERAMVYGGRLDGHLVQGHVDGLASCTHIEDMDGSYEYTFSYDKRNSHLLVDKGSIAINGVSLTLISPTDTTFQVAIIPYTWEHTTFRDLKAGDKVNLEYDILGKYVARQMRVKY